MTHFGSSLIQSNLRKSSDTNVINTDNTCNDASSSLYERIACKLSSQENLPKEQRRIFDDIELPKLPFSQPREIYDTIKQQFNAAKWQP
eukprot:CAMPEP_0202690512 /NCGR_PEP_ID=MMETSP1385-20130828/5473_1 /ASSEMBLY_ACC=CAM_ASM_000861 /TAXON_ID=933848 /ORGANISM="Elphidium margaritaceum" /LENGTH=88 /DNA_ID=CAMNT_0049345779 /DNA_START=196 /DNA_END=462 /DNA_ORIENTATION=+